MSADKTVRLNLQCTDEGTCTVAFEPYGATHELRPGDVFHIEVTGPGSGELSILHSPDAISLWPWDEGDFTVHDGQGQELAT